MNGHSEEVSIATSNGSLDEETINSKKLKRKSLSLENTHSLQERRQRKGSESCEDGESGKKPVKNKLTNGADEPIPSKKSKTVTLNGEDQPGPLKSDGVKKKKKKMLAA